MEDKINERTKNHTTTGLLRIKSDYEIHLNKDYDGQERLSPTM